MYKIAGCLFRKLVAYRYVILLVTGLVLPAVGLNAGLVVAAEDAGTCQKYNKAIENCDSAAVLALWEDEKEVDEDCVKAAVKDYYARCFRLKLSKALKACDLKLLLKEEALVKNFNGQPMYPIMREMVRHNKCNLYVNKCLGEILNKAVKQDNWQAIVEIEKLTNSKELSNCGNNSRLIDSVKKARDDYFERWVSQKMAHSVKVYDLEEIYRLESFIYKEIQDSPDFQKMIEGFLKLKCRDLNNILEYTLNEAVSDCDLNQIQDIEDLLLFKWKKNCLGYDYKAMEDRILQAKQSYMSGCLEADLEKYVGQCDLGRILELEKLAESYNAQDIIQEISAGKCLKLVNCWEAELKFAVDSCNHNRLQELEALLDSSFSKCQNSTALENLLEQQQQNFYQVCTAGSKANPQPKGVSPPVASPADTEAEWISKVNSLIDNYKASKKGAPPLAKINKIISNEFKNNILQPPLLNKNLTAASRRAKFVSLIKTMLNVQQKLAYDRYLDSVLEIITAKMFGVKAGKKRLLLSAAGLKRVEDLFKGMDKELRAALSELNNPQASYKFFTKFYFPLIKIDGLLNYIYQYDGQQPFVYFINSLDKDSLEASFKELLKFAGAIDFVNAEGPFSELLAHYYIKRNKNIWKQPDLVLSKNINLPVFINVLKAQEGRLSEDYDLRAILDRLLEHIDNKNYLIKRVDYEAQQIEYYNNMSYFDFIYNDLLIPLEVKTFSLRDENNEPIPLDKLVNEENKLFLGAETRVTGRDKVDGRLRQIFLDKIINFRLPQMMISQQETSTDLLMQQMREQIKGYLEKKVSVAVFLPNSQYNNAGQAYEIEGYNKLKQNLFISLKSSIADAGSSAEIADILISMLRLNKSYRSGDLQISFYIVTNDIYKNYFSLLDEPDKKRVLIERLKLGLSNRILVDKNSFKIFLSQVGSINNDLTAMYPLELPNINSLNDAVTYRLAQAEQAAAPDRTIAADKDEMTFLLIRNLEIFLQVLNAEADIILKNGLFAYQEIDRIIDLYNHRLPLSGSISQAAPRRDRDILSLLIIDDIRYPLAVFNNKFAALHEEIKDKSITKYINRVAGKMIMYNFLAWEALFDAVDTEQPDIFKLQRKFEYNFLDFDLLIPITEVKQYSAHDFLEKTFNGIVLNLGLLKGADDDLIRQYFFSDASVPENMVQEQTGSRINSYDDIIRKAIKLAHKSSSEELKSKFAGFIQNQAMLFFEVYSKFSSTLGIQKLWEKLLIQLAQASQKPDKDFFVQYQGFYFSAHFLGHELANIEFRPDVISGFNKTFYAEERELKGRLSNYFKLCNGEAGGNLGLKGVFKTYQNTNVDYIKVYKKAAQKLMLSVFEGKGMAAEEAYLGRMFYDNQKEEIKPIADADLYSDDFYMIYDFIWESAHKLADRPELRRLFVEDNVWKMANRN